MQDPDLACKELDRCLENGHRGVEIGNHVGDDDLDSEGVVTFLQHCAQRDVPVFVHPWDMASSPVSTGGWRSGSRRCPPRRICRSSRSSWAGVFDRVDERLRIAFAHGGGSFAFWVGRMDNAWRNRHDVIGTSLFPPSYYAAGRFYVDSVVFDERALRLLIDTPGATNVLVGSDYPYPLGERPVGNVVRNSTALDEQTRALITSGNARRFLGAPAPHAAVWTPGGVHGPAATEVAPVR